MSNEATKPHHFKRYLRLKAEHGAEQAIALSQGERSRYNEIWYFGPPRVRRQVRRERARLVERGSLSQAEADRIYTLWYPLAKTVEEKQQEADEDGVDLDGIDRRE